MLPTFTALNEDGEGVTVHTVDGTAADGPAARPSADAAAHTTIADLLMLFFMIRALLEGWPAVSRDVTRRKLSRTMWLPMIL
ncbi:hypothetical protein SHKM778_75900 [Streptomyces sp. KM77-8]|uniref:Uncharacterized protein n=1 Tax=Streptomyces haneummycinicus TaxID=3074435 RepID=A0AAT9HUA9_9ACTN